MAALLVLAVTPAVAAQEVPQVPLPAAPAVRLGWDAPAGACPTQAELAARLHGLLGDAPLDLDATARVQHVPTAVRTQRWRLDLQLRWARGSDDRTLQASECDELADATVVLVAVLATPLALARRLGPASGASIVPAPSITSAPSTTSAPSSTTAPSIASAPSITPALALAEPAAPPRVLAAMLPLRRRGPFARVVGVAGLGVMPRGDFGVALAVGGLFARVRLEGAWTLLPTQQRDLGDGSGRGGAVSFAAAALRACPRFLTGPVELSLCGAVEAGATWSRSLGVDPVRRGAGPWLAFALGGALDWWFSPQIALHVALDGLAAPVRTRYALGDQFLFGAGNFGLRGALGLTFALAQQKPAGPEKQRR